jgi:hypothetical protein
MAAGKANKKMQFSLFFGGRDVVTGIKAGIFGDAAQIPYFNCHES